MKSFYFAKRKHREDAPQSLKTKSRLALHLVPAATILVALAISIPISAQTITTFDAPGAGTGAGQGTRAFSIDPSGTIIGYIRDANEVRHGFIRSKDGSFTIFDAPGAGTAAGQGTRAYSINPSGAITGFFFDLINVAHGYVRSNQSEITSMRRARARAPAKAPLFSAPSLSTPRGRSQDITSTRPS